MIHFLIHKFPTVYLLVYFSSTFCRSQNVIWNHRGRNEALRYKPEDVPSYNSFYQGYGPQVQGDCRMKASILDERAIDATRDAIRQCTEEHTYCYHEHNNKFRSLDGTCNNIKHPSWAKSRNCFQRILPHDYADGVSLPRVSCTGKELPNPRLVSNVFHKEKVEKRKTHTTHFMEWGQMLAHDLSLNDIIRTPESGYNEPINCCAKGPTVDGRCMSVPRPTNDAFYDRSGDNCINLVRTEPCPVCKAGKRFHYNENTGFHDLSLVYGSTKEAAKGLRSGDRGMLGVEYNRLSGPMPPTVPVNELCVSQARRPACYYAGDPRVNQNPFILTVHVYLLRHHNFLCQELHDLNPHWDDERIYQEARRINIAVAQFITYGHYLPHVLGEIMEKEGIQVLPGAQYTTYDPELEPSIADEYTTVAARYGHTLIPSEISDIDPKTGKTETTYMRDLFYTPFGFRYGQFDSIAKGMTVDKKMKHDVFLTSDVRDYLYRRLYLNETVGGDLASISIARGRDHGIAGYTYYLSYLFNITVQDFNELKTILPPKSVELLESLYESVHDIDLYSASLAEYYVPGGFVGMTFGSILGQQYKRLKFGDRYWFEHRNQAGTFTPEQLQEIKRSSLSRILCETTRLRKIQKDVFFPPSATNPVVPCDVIHRFNFDLWKE